MIDECSYIKLGNVYSYLAKWNKISHVMVSPHNGDDIEIVDRNRSEMEFKFHCKSAEFTIPLVDSEGHKYSDELYYDAINEVRMKYCGVFTFRMLGNPYSVYGEVPKSILSYGDNVVVCISEYDANTVSDIIKLADTIKDNKNISLEMKCTTELSQLVNSIATLWKYITGRDAIIVNDDEDES